MTDNGVTVKPMLEEHGALTTKEQISKLASNGNGQPGDGLLAQLTGNPLFTAVSTTRPQIVTSI
jgi:hypothetical protein